MKFPDLFSGSNRTLIYPSSPGSIKPVDQLGVVQPQPAFTFFSLRGSSPEL